MRAACCAAGQFTNHAARSTHWSPLTHDLILATSFFYFLVCPSPLNDRQQPGAICDYLVDDQGDRLGHCVGNGDVVCHPAWGGTRPIGRRLRRSVESTRDYAGCGWRWRTERCVVGPALLDRYNSGLAYLCHYLCTLAGRHLSFYGSAILHFTDGAQRAVGAHRRLEPDAPGHQHGGGPTPGRAATGPVGAARHDGHRCGDCPAGNRAGLYDYDPSTASRYRSDQTALDSG